MAIKDIKDGKLTPLEASKAFNIPRTTLICKTTGKRPKGIVRSGPESLQEWH